MRQVLAGRIEVTHNSHRPPLGLGRRGYMPNPSDRLIPLKRRGPAARECRRSATPPRSRPASLAPPAVPQLLRTSPRLRHRPLGPASRLITRPLSVIRGRTWPQPSAGNLGPTRSRARQQTTKPTRAKPAAPPASAATTLCRRFNSHPFGLVKRRHDWPQPGTSLTMLRMTTPRTDAVNLSAATSPVRTTGEPGDDAVNRRSSQSSFGITRNKESAR